MKATLQRIVGLDAHHRLIVGMAVALMVYVFARERSAPVRLVLAWDAFAGAFLVLGWLRMIMADAKTSVQQARLQDSSRTAIFVFVICAALASLFAAGYLLGATNDLRPAARAEHALFAGATVILSWLLTHTLFALHYAHVFYQASNRAPTRTGGEGVEFPGEKYPDFLDFAYFSFVIGMTCQVSDVQITSRDIRRTALVQGLLAFIFNTVILAWSINLAAGLIR